MLELGLNVQDKDGSGGFHHKSNPVSSQYSSLDELYNNVSPPFVWIRIVPQILRQRSKAPNLLRVESRKNAGDSTIFEEPPCACSDCLIWSQNGIGIFPM